MNIKLEEEIKLHKEICERIHSLFADKRHDYGQTTEELLKLYGPTSMLTFLRTKLSRLDNLLLNNKLPNFESIDDTLIDLANYAIIWLTEIRKEYISARLNENSANSCCGGNKCH